MEKFRKIGVRVRIKYLFILFFYVPFLPAQEAYKTDNGRVQQFRQTAIDCLNNFYGQLSEINLIEDDELPDFVETIISSVHEEAYFFPIPGTSIKNKQPQTCKMFTLHFLSELKQISPSANFRIELSEFAFRSLFLTEDKRKLTLEVAYRVSLYGNGTLQYVQQANAVILFPSYKNTWSAWLKQVNNISEKETRTVEWGETEEQAIAYLNNLRLQNYKDTIIQTSEYIYKGGVNAANQAHGVGEITWLSEKYKEDYYYGQWINGYRTGKGVYKWPSGNIYRGEWIKNKLTGKGIYKWADGSEYIGDWKEEERTGKGFYKWPNGDEYTGDFVKGERTGKGFYKWLNGDEYTGDFVKNNLTGKGTFKKKDGTIQSGTFKDGVFMGNDN